jgi:male germ cell-associated kinase
MNRYELLERLGDGSFGEVTKARSLKTKELVAIKKMKTLFPTWEECLQLRELKSLRVLRHENVVQLKEVIRDKEELYFVFEYMQSSLHKVLRHHQRLAASAAAEDMSPTQLPAGWLTEPQIKSIMFQLLSGLAYMHKHGFFHRDIKPENLLCHDETLKIADLGQAREIRARPPFTDYVSTRWYRSPELLLRTTTYNSPIDLWACGCIMAELFLQTPLFAGSSEADQLCRIARVLGSPTKDNWPEATTTLAQMQFKFPKCAPVQWTYVLPAYTSKAAVQLISELVQYDPSRRLTAAQALQHRFFDQHVPRNAVSLTTAKGSSASVPPATSMFSLPLKAEQKPGGGGGWATEPAVPTGATTSRWWRESASTLPTSHSDTRKHYEPPRADTNTTNGGGAGGGGGSSKAAGAPACTHTATGSTTTSWLSARKWTSPEMDDDGSDASDARVSIYKHGDDKHDEGDAKHAASESDRKPPLGRRSPSFRLQDHQLQDLLDEFLA